MNAQQRSYQVFKAVESQRNDLIKALQDAKSTIKILYDIIYNSELEEPGIETEFIYYETMKNIELALKEKKH